MASPRKKRFPFHKDLLPPSYFGIFPPGSLYFLTELSPAHEVGSLVAVTDSPQPETALQLPSLVVLHTFAFLMF